MRQKIDCLAVRICTVLCFLFISGTLFAQKVVTGTVTNASTNQPLPSATVTVKGTNIGAATDVAGKFTLNVPAGKNTLVVSSIGYTDQEVDITSTNTVSVALKESVSNLDEIVVTGYTAQKKKSLTGSVAIVNVKELKDVPAGSPEQQLQGRAAGVTIVSSGQPGTASSIRIRGITGFGNNDPLVIIDGTPGSLRDINANDIESMQVLKDAGAASIYGVRGSNGVIIVTTKRGKAGKTTITYDGFYGTQRPPTGNVFHLLNTNEMAQVTWLAQSNSHFLFSADADQPFYPSHPQYGTATAPVDPSYLNNTPIGALPNWGSSGANPIIPDYILVGGTSGFVGEPTADQLAQYNIDYSKGDIYQITRANKTGTDWFHEVFKPAPWQSHTISASGGGDKSAYYFSLGYFDQKGVLMNTYLKRYDVRVNTLFNVKNNIRIGENIYMFAKENPQISNQTENVIGMTFREQPIIPVYDINGGWAGTRAGGLGNAENPVENQWSTKDNKGYSWDMTGNVFAEIDFLRHFTARTSFGGAIDNGYYYYYGYHRYSDAENNTSNSFTEGAGYNRNYTWTNTINYKNIFGKHSLNVLGGIEAIENYGRGVSGSALGFFTDNPNFRILPNGSSPGSPPNGSYVYTNSLYSQFGQLNYGYDEKYLIGATVRRDGSSVFGPEKRYGVFPAFSAGWVISKESFMQNVTFFNNLKLRGSWGKLGNNLNVNSANAFNLFGSSFGSSYYDINGTSTSTVQGFYATRYGNPATGWEEDKISNIGLDAVILKNKVEFSIEWYNKSIKGLLFDAQAGALVGGGSLPKVNIGDVSNKGIDFSGTYHGTVGKDFKFDVTAVLSHYKSNITSIPGDYFDDAFLRIQPLVRNQNGHPISAFYGYQVLGLFQSQDDVDKSPTQPDAAPGRFKFADVNGDGQINADDRTFIGNPNPDFTYGLNLSIAYKGFDFSTFLYGTQGNDIFNYVRYWTDFYPSFQGVKSQDLLYNSWLPSRPNAKTPVAELGSNFSNNVYPNSYYVENGSYLRCKSMILGYTVPADQLRRIGLDKLRIYVQAANLFTITKYTGLDPEIQGPIDGNTGEPSNSNFGIDQANYPSIRTFIVGVNLSF